MNWTEVVSPREAQVVEAMGHGQSVSEIARTLGLSVKTVSTFRTRALVKLTDKGLIQRPTTAEAMRLVITNEVLATR